MPPLVRCLGHALALISTDEFKTGLSHSRSTPTMAAPAEMTTLDISGKYMMNKSLGDDTDEILRLQGVGWFTRKAIAMATIYLSVKHYKDHSGIEHIDIDQTLTGGISGTSEYRILDWSERPHDDHIFGPVLSRSRRFNVEEIKRDWLKSGWTDDTKEHGVVHTYAESDTPKSGTSWSMDQTWGFEEVKGEARRYVRHLFFTGPKSELIEARLVYDYQGGL